MAAAQTGESKKQEVVNSAEKQASLIVNNKFVDDMAKQVRLKQEYGLTFPADYNPTNALNGAYLVIQEAKDKNGKPVLQSCTQASIAHTLMDMVTMGLSMQKKQCYPVAYGGKLQCQVSYHGHKAMAHRYGAKSINAEVIYDGDEFSYHIENGRKVLDKHVQCFQNIDLEKIVGAYCIANLSDGSTYMEVMNIRQIETAWKKGYGYKKGSGTHSEFADMMAKKTVTSRVCKQIVQQYGDVFAVDVYEQVESHADDDRVSIDTDYEISQNANSVDFPEEDVIDIDTSEVLDGQEDVVEEPKETDGDIPDCFKE